MNLQSLWSWVALGAAVPLCRFALGRGGARGLGVLTAVSALFYLANPQGPLGLLVLAAGMAVTWGCLKLLARGRSWGLWAGCGYHIAVLAGFKYLGFFTGGALSAPWAPVGLSFFTFQQLWCLHDAARGLCRPTAGELGACSLFFPTVTSGPILRPGDFCPQVRRGPSPGAGQTAPALWSVAVGLGKKVLLADNLGILVDNGWADPAALSAPGAWLVMVAYALQLYLDFSGYCDIAAGLAALLGISLPDNFRAPYRALSVGEFWRRWHITLTAFLRECVYFPLGGSRRGALRTYRNILVVFLISGLWHGAGWTFLIWGALHGLAQIVERAWGAGRQRLPKALRWAMTAVFLTVAWVFFRAPDLSGAMAMLRSAVAGGAALPGEALFSGVLDAEVTALGALLPGVKDAGAPLAAAAVVAVGAVVSLLPGSASERLKSFRPTAARLFWGVGISLWSLLSLSAMGSFIYSGF